ncbi:MAG: hypothetical protein GEU80_05245 [Dehalococcoidia bacterium]|nr:hypothetical protein [Dehalococcoidia bacterium]
MNVIFEVDYPPEAIAEAARRFFGEALTLDERTADDGPSVDGEPLLFTGDLGWVRLDTSRGIDHPTRVEIEAQELDDAVHDFVHRLDPHGAVRTRGGPPDMGTDMERHRRASEAQPAPTGSSEGSSPGTGGGPLGW